MEKKVINVGEITPAAKATYRELVQLGNKGGEVWKWELDKIVVQEDWNDRMDFGDIPDLAEAIYANGGTEDILGDVMKDGTFVITDGERRYMAFLILAEKYPDVAWVKFMNVKINSKDMSKSDRLFKKLTANDGKLFEPLEEAMAYKKLLEDGNSQADIAKRLGKNRMHVSNRVVLSNITKIEMELVQEKLISTTEWVKLYKLVPDVVKRVNYLLDAKKSGEVLNDVEGNIAAAYSEDTLDKMKTAAGEKEQAEGVDVIDDQEGIKSGEYTQPPVPAAEQNNGDIYDNDEKEFIPTGIMPGKPEPFTGIGDGPKRGLAALLDKSTVPPSEEPLEIKTKGFTAKQIISDEVGSTLGDQTPETGTVEETLKEMAILLRSLERYFNGDSRMTDLSFKVDKKLRYLQGIAKKSMLGKLTGDVVTQPKAEETT